MPWVTAAAKAILGQRAADWLKRSFPIGDEQVLAAQLRKLGYGNHSNFFDSGEEHFIKVVAAAGYAGFAVDVGANAGGYASLLGANGFKRAMLFEPHPAHTQSLTEIAAAFGYEVRCAALGDKTGFSELRFDPNRLWLASLSTEVEQIPYLRNGASQSVPLTTLDDVCRELEWPEVDLLKIDVEGWEHEVLVGAQELFRTRPPSFIQIEYNWHQLFRGHSLYSLARQVPDGYECFQLLARRRGFRRVEVRDPMSNVFMYSNFVFVRPDRIGALTDASRS